MEDRVNIFDVQRYAINQSKMSLILHSDSLEEQIRSMDEMLIKIDRLNAYDEICVQFTPPSSVEIEKIIKENYNSGIYTIKVVDNYLIYENYNKTHSRLLQMLRGNQEKKYFEKLNDSNLKLIDTVTVEDINAMLLVVSNDDYNKNSNIDYLRKLSDVIEIVRLYMISQGLFYLRPRYIVDELQCYIYRFKKCFIHIKNYGQLP